MITASEVIEERASAANVVDVVGAGDAFTAGAVFGLLHDWPPARTLALANTLAGVVVGHVGAMPPVADDYRDILAELG